MSDVILSLGGVSFRDMEVPEQIFFGGSQRLSVQNTIGNNRVVEAIGGNDGDIFFSGIFSGSDAVERAQLLDSARNLGTKLPLAWKDFYYLVVIRQFSAVYCKPNLIPFSIDCTVVSDPLADTAASLAPIASLISDDFADAMVFCGSAGISPESISSASLSTVNILQSNILGSISASGVALEGGKQGLSTALTPLMGESALTQIFQASQQQAALVGMSGFVNRAAVNLSLEQF